MHERRIGRQDRDARRVLSELGRTITNSFTSTSFTPPVSKKYMRPAFMKRAPITVRGVIMRPPANAAA